MCLLLILSQLPERANAASSIPDGNAMGNNFNPFQVDKNSYNKRWNNQRFDRGLRFGIYTGKTSDPKKANWKIEYTNKYTGKNEPYLTFTGWSMIVYYHHHSRYNQATYINAVNTKTGQEKMYKLEMTNLNGTKDIEYNKRSNDPNDIYNLCGNNVFKKLNTECNMRYEYVGFKAWLPLNELFPDGNTSAEWELYLVKNVEGHVEYRALQIPYSFSGLDFKNGKINLSSGVNANKLYTTSNVLLRRHYPRQSEYIGATYFEPYRQYQMVASDESTGATTWYGVSSPHDGGATRWNSAVFWEMSGQTAKLSYQPTKKTCPDGSVVNINQDCQINVTINHIDKDTKKTLRTEVKKATVGKTYSFSAEPKGTFKDSNGNPYVSVPANAKYSGTAPNRNISLTFEYRVSLPNPSKIHEFTGATEGRASGDFLWKLDKENNDSESRMLIENTLSISGKHYDIRNVEYKASSSGVFSRTEGNKLHLYMADPNQLKGKTISYEFSYEYTNHYRSNYVCVEQQGSDCFKWQFKDYTPVWDDSYRKKATWKQDIVVDHEYGNEFTFLDESSDTLSLIIGRYTTINGNQQSQKSNGVWREHITVDKSPVSLLSQNWTPINEEIKYLSDLGNRLYVLPEHMYYYPIDLDENLRGKYRNTTPYAYTEYAIPLRLENYKIDSVTLKSADNFFLTKNTGFLFSVPASVTSDTEIRAKAKEAYELFTNEKYDDEVLTSISDGSRYYFNIDPNNSLKPKTWYSNNFVVGKIGLSDVTLHVNQKIQFEKYLVGSPIDQPLINAQPEPVIHGIEYPHSVVITPEQLKQIKELSKSRGKLLHSFRSTDIAEKYNQLKNILPSLSP